MSANRSAVRFGLLFPVLILLSFAALRSDVLTAHLVLPFAALIARLDATVLGLLGAGASLSGTVITGPGVALEVIDKCSAIYEIGIFLSAVIAYPARMRQKMMGAALGSAAIFILGLLRVLSIQRRNDTRTPARPIELYEEKMKSLDKSIEVHWFDAGHLGSFPQVEQAIEHQELMLHFAYRILS